MRHIALVAALSAALSLLVFSGTASAANPNMQRIEVDEFVPAFLDCGSYSLDYHNFGFVIFRAFVKDGELVMTLENVALKFTWSNPDTGESLTYPGTGVDHLTIFSDGSATLVHIGILSRIVVPGEGIVAGEIGRVELFFTSPTDMDADITVSGIQKADAIEDALCAALAPPV